MTRRATAEERAEAVGLALVVGPVEAARRLGLPARTVSDWRRRAVERGDPALVATRDALADRLWRAVELATNQVEAGLRDPKARLGERAQALRVLVDAHALVAGEATQRVEAVNVNVGAPVTDVDRRDLLDWLAAQAPEEADRVE